MVEIGYRETEIGVFPEDWEVLTFGSIIEEFRGGAPLRPSDFKRVGVKVLPKGGVGRTGWLAIQNSDLQYCSPEYANAHRSNQVDETFAIIVLRDLVPSGPSIGLIVQIKDSDTYILAQGVYGFKVTQNTDSSYLVQLSNTFWYRKLANSMMVGSTQVHITNTALKLAKIPLPPIQEQSAIAAALSDADALITSLDALIAKKRDLKQAAMQQLLTGKIRLPGFKGEWELKLLKDICWFQEGPGVRNYQFTNSGVKLLNGTNISKGRLYLEKTTRFISEAQAFGQYSHFVADENDIVVASSGITIEKFHEKIAVVSKWDLPLCMNTSTIRFKPKREHLADRYLTAFLESTNFKTQIGGQATGSAQLNFGPSHLSKVEVFLPPLEEQIAIADVFSDVDAELTALEAKRDKANAIKQGMMQELLTGRIRLI